MYKIIFKWLTFRFTAVLMSDVKCVSVCVCEFVCVRYGQIYRAAGCRFKAPNCLPNHE